MDSRIGVGRHTHLRGISAIPTMLLVDKDGKVVSLNARGEKLREELARLLGPVEEEKPGKKEKAQQ